MMKKLIFMFFVILLIACKPKEYPEPTEEGIKYTAFGKLNNDNFTLIAGENNMEQKTVKKQNIYGVYEYVSSFKTMQCNYCNSKFKIKINGSSIKDMGQNENFFNSVHIGQYSLASSGNITNSSSFQMYVECSDPQASYNWILASDLSTVSNLKNPVYTSILYKDFYAYLDITLGNGSIFQSANFIQDFDGLDISLPISVKATESEFNITPLFSLNNLPENIVFDSLSVDIGFENKTSDVDLKTLSLPVGYNKNVHYTLNFTNLSTNTHYQKRYTFALTNPFTGEFKLGNMKYVASTLNTNNIEIEYFSNNNQKYSSILGNNGNNQFKIISIEEGGISPSGQKTKTVKGVFSANLVNELDPTDIIFFENVNFQMAFEY